jgi:vacuolar iron transporter family protein
MTNEHFQGKSAFEHLKDARLKGSVVSREIHGVEMPGYLFAGMDAVKETAVALLLITAFLTSFSLPLKELLLSLFLFSIGWIIWKVGRSAALQWSRLEKLHRMIEEERWEIQHHREQEREELVEMYSLKGFHGKLLDDVVEVLMADDNRLLSVMLEEELGLSVETHEHPILQSLGAFLGSLIASGLIIFSTFLGKELGGALTALSLVCIASYFSAHILKNKRLPLIVWELALALLSLAATYFLSRFFFSAMP